MPIPVTSGQTYTFTFTETFSLSDELGGTGKLVSDAIINAGFPVSATKWTGFAGSVDFTFTYGGAYTDSDALGQAMADTINAVASGTWSLAGVVQGAPLINPSTPGATTITNAGSSISAALPSASTLGIGALAILILLVAVYSFSGAVGSKVA